MTDTDNISSRERLNRALRCQPLNRPPVWMMRQAGRALPEYRRLKETRSFVELVQTPELACEVTLQPIRRFGFDAAILFSDILVINEALGQPYSFREAGGIEMDVKIRTGADVAKLTPDAVADRLQYVADALKLIRTELGDRTGLLGFSGSPWTLACFMFEGGSSKEFTTARKLFYTDRPLFERVSELLTRSIIAYLNMQIDCGVDAVQIFDTLGGGLAECDFHEASGKWIREIVAGLNRRVPAIVFSRGTNAWNSLADTGADVLGADWTVDLPGTRRLLSAGFGDIGVQGNLDPVVLETTPGIAAAETSRLLKSMTGLDGHIFNLGHGVRPTSNIDCIQAVVDAVTCHSEESRNGSRG